MNTNSLWINNSLYTIFSVTCVIQVLSAARANTFASNIEEHKLRELQSEIPWGISTLCRQMTLREISGNSQSKLDCLIF